MSWTPTDEQVEKAAEALDSTKIPASGASEWHLIAARAVLVAVGPHIAASALRDAADAADEDPKFRDPLRLKADWIRDRADTIEKEAGR